MFFSSFLRTISDLKVIKTPPMMLKYLSPFLQKVGEIEIEARSKTAKVGKMNSCELDDCE